jgi:hypothetical protein
VAAAPRRTRLVCRPSAGSRRPRRRRPRKRWPARYCSRARTREEADGGRGHGSTSASGQEAAAAHALHAPLLSLSRRIHLRLCLSLSSLAGEGADAGEEGERADCGVCDVGGEEVGEMGGAGGGGEGGAGGGEHRVGVDGEFGRGIGGEKKERGRKREMCGSHVLVVGMEF